MTALIFVDTNLFVYAQQGAEALKQPLAQQWLERLWNDRNGRTSIQVLNELYVTLTRKIRPAYPTDAAWEIVRSLLVWKPQALDDGVLLRACEIETRYRLSWWDSLIVGAAQAQNCTLLLSEDLQDRGVYGGVTVRNPFVLGVSEAQAEYVGTPTAASRHRARGRPKGSGSRKR